MENYRREELWGALCFHAVPSTVVGSTFRNQPGDRWRATHFIDESVEFGNRQ